jgi:hypothetical protein
MLEHFVSMSSILSNSANNIMVIFFLPIYLGYLWETNEHFANKTQLLQNELNPIHVQHINYWTEESCNPAEANSAADVQKH